MKYFSVLVVVLGTLVLLSSVSEARGPYTDEQYRDAVTAVKMRIQDARADYETSQITQEERDLRVKLNQEILVEIATMKTEDGNKDKDKDGEDGEDGENDNDGNASIDVEGDGKK